MRLISWTHPRGSETNMVDWTRKYHGAVDNLDDIQQIFEKSGEVYVMQPQ
jgi:hypothetical protein